VSGERLDQFRLRLPQVYALKPDYCILLGGTNDVGVRSVQEMKADGKYIIEALLANGIRPVVLPILPRNGLPTVQLQRLVWYNNWLREYVRSVDNVVWVDPTYQMQDAANAAGNQITGISDDGLHPNQKGGYILGKAISDVVSPMFPLAASEVLNVADIYDAVNNPGGNLLTDGSSNWGLCAGTTGTKIASTGFTPSGSLASGFTINRSPGSSTCAAVCSKENPRTDGPASGERQVVAVSVTAAGSSNELIKITPSLRHSNLNAGDVVFAQAAMELVSPVNILSLELRTTDVRTSGNEANYDGGWPGTGPLLEGFAGVWRTPPIEIGADSTSFLTELVLRIKGDTGAASCTLKISDVSLRKVQ
jgi:hypothetical protein